MLRGLLPPEKKKTGSVGLQNHPNLIHASRLLPKGDGIRAFSQVLDKNHAIVMPELGLRNYL